MSSYNLQNIAYDLSLLQETRKTGGKKKRLCVDRSEHMEMQCLHETFQKNDNKLQILNLNAQILESNMSVQQLTSELVSQKRAYDSIIAELQANNKHNNQLLLSKENEQKNLMKDLIKLNDTLSKLKKDSNAVIMSKDQKIKSFNMVEKNFKDRFNQEKLSMQNNINDMSKTLIKMKSDLVNAQSYLENKTKLMENIKEESMNKNIQIATLMNSSEKYEQAEIQIKILESQISILKAKIKSDKCGSEKVGKICENYRMLEKENSDLKKSIASLNSRTDQNFLLVTELERVRHRAQSQSKICEEDYPRLKHTADANARELGVWRSLAQTFKRTRGEALGEDGKPGGQVPSSTASCEVNPRVLLGILEGLDSRHHLLDTENEMLKNRLSASRADLLRVNSELSESKAERMKIQSSHDSVIGNLKGLREKMAQIKPKSDKLHHYLEHRSIIPKGHSEYQNFQEVFVALRDLFNLQLFPESDTTSKTPVGSS